MLLCPVRLLLARIHLRGGEEWSKERERKGGGGKVSLRTEVMSTERKRKEEGER